MGYARFVSLARTYLKDHLGVGTAESLTYNALRCLMPTGADVLQFSDTVAAAIGNWQEVPGGRGDKRGGIKNQMAKGYAGEKIITAGCYKLLVAVAIHRSEGDERGASWEAIGRHRSDKKVLKAEAGAFNMR